MNIIKNCSIMSHIYEEENHYTYLMIMFFIWRNLLSGTLFLFVSFVLDLFFIAFVLSKILKFQILSSSLLDLFFMSLLSLIAMHFFSLHHNFILMAIRGKNFNRAIIAKSCLFLQFLAHSLRCTFLFFIFIFGVTLFILLREYVY